MDFKQRFSGKISIITRKGLKSNLLQPEYQLPKSYTLKEFPNSRTRNPDGLKQNALTQRNTARSYNLSQSNEKNRYGGLNPQRALNRKLSQKIQLKRQYVKQQNSLQKLTSPRKNANSSSNEETSIKFREKILQSQKKVPYFYIDSMFEKHSNFIMMLDRKLSYRV